jgi:hypothetical protein
MRLRTLEHSTCKRNDATKFRMPHATWGVSSQRIRESPLAAGVHRLQLAMFNRRYVERQQNTSDMNTQLMKVGGHEITFTGKPYESMLRKSGSLVSPREFIAKHAGLEVTTTDKGRVLIEGKAEQTMKDVKAMIVAKHGDEKSKTIVKAGNALYDAGRSAFYTDSTKICALVGADASLRKIAKPVFGKKGFMGFNISARVERKQSANSGLAEKLAATQAQLDAALAKLGQRALESGAQA